MRFIKVVGEMAVYAHKNSIISAEISKESLYILNYYNKIPANRY